MYRLQVLPIRLVILSLALLCLWLTAPGWIQPMVRLSLQRTFGTAVDFEKCHLDWSQGGLQLTNVQISDPEDPLRNLIQANQVWVEFNPQSARIDLVIEAKAAAETPRSTGGSD